MRRLLCLKADCNPQVSDVSKQLQRIADYYLSARGLRRELLAAAICLVVGVLVMPCLIFACGRLVLGPYAHGNLFALWRDFLHGLGAGSQASWFILLGPYLLLWLLRAARELLHNRAAPGA
jgi:hypothetical protein